MSNTAPKKTETAPAPRYDYVAIRESVQDPQRALSTFQFASRDGYSIARDAAGWVVVTCTRTGTVIDFPPGNVKELRKMPPPKDAA